MLPDVLYTKQLSCVGRAFAQGGQEFGRGVRGTVTIFIRDHLLVPAEAVDGLGWMGIDGGRRQVAQMVQAVVHDGPHVDDVIWALSRLSS